MAYEFASRLETFPNYRKFETTFAGRRCLAGIFSAAF